MVYPALAFAILAVSCSAILIRWATAPPLVVAADRMLAAITLLMPLWLWRGRKDLHRLGRRELLAAAASGLFLALHFGAWTVSLFHTSVASSVVFVSTHPVFVALAEWWLFRQRPSALGWLGIVLTVLGSLVIGWGDLQLGPDSLLGDGLALLGAMAMVGYLLIGRWLRRGLGALSYSLLVYTPCWLALSLASLATGAPPWQFSARDLAVFVGLAALSTLGGHTVFNWALRHVPAAVVAVAFVGEPLVAALLAWPLLGEQPPRATVVGGAVILVGIYLASRGSGDRG